MTRYSSLKIGSIKWNEVRVIFLKMTISGGILIVLIFPLRILFINRLPKQVFVLLWDIVILRLLIPFDLPIRYGISSRVTNSIGKGIRYHGQIVTPIFSHSSARTLSEKSHSFSYFAHLHWMTLVWFFVMITLFLFLGMMYFKEYQKMQAALPLSKKEEDYLKSIVHITGRMHRKRFNIKRIKLMVSDQISTPLTFGIFCPKIIFPKAWKAADVSELKYVLTHEMIHIKRWDNLWKVLMLAAICVHWFNPLILVMYFLFHRDLELSCDEKVIMLLGEKIKKEYAMALLNLAQQQSYPVFFSNGFGKNAIHERIEAIMKFKKATFINMGCAVLLLVGAATVFAKNTSGLAKEKNPSYTAGENVSVESTDASAESTDASAKSADVSMNYTETVNDEDLYSEYKEYGLTYDSSKSHLYYQGDIVAYITDEISNNNSVYIYDAEGTRGLRVERDSDHKITEIEETEIPDDIREVSPKKSSSQGMTVYITASEDAEYFEPSSKESYSSDESDQEVTYELIEGTTSSSVSENESYSEEENVSLSMSSAD